MTPTRFGTLDALRGLAALAVVLFHFEEVRLTGPLVPGAYLAVDFFFILSGFVIAYTYEPKLRGGMPIKTFLVRRIIRLYPMALLGVGLGAVILLFKLKVEPSRVDPLGSILEGVAANGLVLPTPFGTPASHAMLFPGNPPLWSVSLEILVNVVWCLVLVRLPTRVLAAIAFVCLVILAITAHEAGSAHIGFDWHWAWGGLARLGYGFGLGVVLYRIKDRLILGHSVAFKIASAALLAGAFFLPRQMNATAGLDLFCIALVLPLAVMCGLNGTDHPRFDSALGRASYPLYAIHFPILFLASGLHQKLPHLGLGVILPLTGISILAATWTVLRFYDEPLRRALAAWWARRDARSGRLGTPGLTLPAE